MELEMFCHHLQVYMKTQSIKSDGSVREITQEFDNEVTTQNIKFKTRIAENIWKRKKKNKELVKFSTL